MKLALFTASVATVLLAQAVTGAALEPAANDVTVVLVHGAFAESSSWSGVIPKLLAKDYKVVAVANPLRSLRTDSAYVETVLENIDGPVILVGHSYGGSVITVAARGHSNVKALVYVDGTAPDVGESTAELSGKFPGGTLGPALAPPINLPDGNKDLYIRRDRYRDQFAADVPQRDTDLMFATQRPITEAALHAPASFAAWRIIPSWFIYGSLDLNIPPAVHAFMANRAGAKQTIEIKGASHVVMVSHPDEVADLIDRAANGPWSTHTHAGPAQADPAVAASVDSSFSPAPVIPLATQSPARLVVDAPLPEQLQRGYVVVRYRAENIRILPVYGPHALEILPRIGHLHVTLDDLPWHWLDSSGEPLSINGLPPGPHKLLIELQDPTHKLIDSATVNFEIPKP